ncbi:MAG: hypothetical protein CMP47_01970 [Rickettsiales bacterium]|nr:hypothetical protein [Rickettsiales bacterium]
MLLAGYRAMFAVGWFGIDKAEAIGVHHGAVGYPSECHFRDLGSCRTKLQLKEIHLISGEGLTCHCSGVGFE